MNTFQNAKQKEACLKAISKTVPTSGMNWLSPIAADLPISNDIGYLADSIFEELPEQDRSVFPAQFIEALPVGKQVSSAYATTMLWVLRDLQRAPSVQEDAELMGFCGKLTQLYEKEITSGVADSVSHAELYGKVSEAWSAAGERKRVSRMAFARKWAWLGARKWAWLGMRPWSATWAFLLAATRPRTRGTTATALLSWAGAWTLRRARSGYEGRMRTARGQFLHALSV